jgi:CheY-like chemotaxis protein
MGPAVQKKVLIIDDDLAMRECISFYLQEGGHTVTVCADGDEG